MENNHLLQKHIFATRMFHPLLALAVVLQLLTSLVMYMPLEGRPDDVLFELHKYSGLSALVLSLGFWLVLALRHQGTEAGQLWPWFSAMRRLALRADTRCHWDAIKTLRLPAYDPKAALPSALHGLGLLLITAMAASGAGYFVALLISATESPVVGLVLEMHQLLANLAWVYLIGHAGLGLIQHSTGNLPLTAMWSLRRKL